jgi:1,4-dihydroxy-2-naphthoate octaprenyltransferase
MSSRLMLGGALLLVVGLTVAAVLLRPPAWLVLLLGSMALALLYTVARMNSRFDPLDQRFGSCIPPINWPPRDQK